MYNRVTSTSVRITNVGLVPYNSMVLTGPEVAIARFILVCSDAVICGIWYRVMASLLEKVRSSWT